MTEQAQDGRAPERDVLMLALDAAIESQERLTRLLEEWLELTGLDTRTGTGFKDVLRDRTVEAVALVRQDSPAAGGSPGNRA